MGPRLEGGSHEQRREDEQRVTLLASEVCPALTGLRGVSKSADPRALPPSALPVVQMQGQGQGSAKG